jgi:hypothetical protein
MQVFWAPIEGTLKDFMEFGETGFADYEHSPPHQRTHAIEYDKVDKSQGGDTQGSGVLASYPSPCVRP